MPTTHLSFMRAAIARGLVNQSLHAQLVAGSREAIARSRRLLSSTEWQIDRPGKPTDPWLLMTEAADGSAI